MATELHQFLHRDSLGQHRRGHPVLSLAAAFPERVCEDVHSATASGVCSVTGQGTCAGARAGARARSCLGAPGRGSKTELRPLRTDVRTCRHRERCDGGGTRLVHPGDVTGLRRTRPARQWETIIKRGRWDLRSQEDSTQRNPTQSIEGRLLVGGHLPRHLRCVLDMRCRKSAGHRRRGELKNQFGSSRT